MYVVCGGGGRGAGEVGGGGGNLIIASLKVYPFLMDCPESLMKV